MYQPFFGLNNGIVYICAGYGLSRNNTGRVVGEMIVGETLV